MWCVVYVGMWGQTGITFFSSRKKAQKYVKKHIKPCGYTYFIAKIDSCSNKEDVLLMTDE